jgi:hypothetical protein
LGKAVRGTAPKGAQASLDDGTDTLDKVGIEWPTLTIRTIASFEVSDLFSQFSQPIARRENGRARNVGIVRRSVPYTE